MGDKGRPACACLTVKYDPVEIAKDKTFVERWRCAECGSAFTRTVRFTRLQDELCSMLLERDAMDERDVKQLRRIEALEKAAGGQDEGSADSSSSLCAIPPAQADDAELMEKAAEAAHDAWWRQKKASGFHSLEECPCKVGHDPDESTSRHCLRCGVECRTIRPLLDPCPKCHKDMRPYVDLDEATKDLDRAHVRAVHAVYVKELEQARSRARDAVRGELEAYARHTLGSRIERGPPSPKRRRT